MCCQLVVHRWYILACAARQWGHAAGATTAPVKPVISLTNKALEHLHKLRAESGDDELLLRIGVKSGGCSGHQGSNCLLICCLG